MYCGELLHTHCVEVRLVACRKPLLKSASVDAGKVVYVPLSQKEPCECRQAGDLPHLGACWAHINGTIASNGLLASLFQ